MPKVGAPERSDIEERKLPSTTGAPGRASWLKLTPAMPSASAWASAPAVVTGPIAPPRMKGAMTMPWFAPQ